MTTIIAALLLICAVSATNGDFVSDVNDILDKATLTLNIGKCVIKARTKGTNFNGNSEMKGAVSMVHLYSQHCKQNNGDVFFSALNTHLGGGSSSDTNFDYSTFGNLLNDALDILQPDYGVNNAEVYRGQIHINHEPDTTYHPNRFFSTSKNPKKAFDRPCFMVIKDAIGVSIKLFSEFAHEDEVLIRYTAEYKVETNTNNTSEMNAVLKPLQVFYPYTRVIVLRQQVETSASAAVKPFNVLYVLLVASLLKMIA